MKNIIEQIRELRSKVCELQDQGNSSNDTNFGTVDITTTGDRTHSWANKNLTIQNLKDFTIQSQITGEITLKHTGTTGDPKENKLMINSSSAMLSFSSLNSNKIAYIALKSGGIAEVFSTDGLVEIPNLKKLNSQNRLIGQYNVDGKIGFIELGTGLSLVNGVLSSTGGGGGGSDTNFALTNLEALSNRVHNFNTYDLSIVNLGALNLTGTGQFSLSTVGAGFYQSNNALAFLVSGKGIRINSAGNIVLDNYLSTRNDPATSKALYVDNSGNLLYGPVSGGGGGGGGEANTISNIGSGGYTWFKQKTGVNFEMRRLKVGTGLTATENADDVTVVNSAPDQVVSLTPGNANVAITGTYPNFTISATGVNKDAFTLTTNGTRNALAGETIIAFFVLPTANLTGFKIGTTDGGEEAVITQDLTADGEWKSFAINYRLASNKTFYIKGITSSTQFEIVKV